METEQVKLKHWQIGFVIGFMVLAAVPVTLFYLARDLTLKISNKEKKE